MKKKNYVLVPQEGGFAPALPTPASEIRVVLLHKEAFCKIILFPNCIIIGMWYAI